MELERAQICLMTVALLKPQLILTTQLQQANSLSIPQLYLLLTLLRQHSITSPSKSNFVSGNRRLFTCCDHNSIKTSFAQKYFDFRAHLRTSSRINKLSYTSLNWKLKKKSRNGYQNSLKMKMKQHTQTLIPKTPVRICGHKNPHTYSTRSLRGTFKSLHFPSLISFYAFNLTS